MISLKRLSNLERNRDFQIFQVLSVRNNLFAFEIVNWIAFIFITLQEIIQPHVQLWQLESIFQSSSCMGPYGTFVAPSLSPCKPIKYIFFCWHCTMNFLQQLIPTPPVNNAKSNVFNSLHTVPKCLHNSAYFKLLSPNINPKLAVSFPNTQGVGCNIFVGRIG